MHTYARIQNGIVAEIIAPLIDENEDEIPIAQRFVPAIVSMLVDVTTVIPSPAANWTAVESNGVWQFSAPAPVVAPT